MARKKSEELQPPKALYEPIPEAYCLMLERIMAVAAAAVKDPEKFWEEYQKQYPHDKEFNGTWMYVNEMEGIKSLILHSRNYRNNLQEWERLRRETRDETAYAAYKLRNPLQDEMVQSQQSKVAIEDQPYTYDPDNPQQGLAF